MSRVSAAVPAPHTAAGERLADSAVIAQSAADPERFAEIFDRHAQAIHRYLARRIGDEIANDLVAEAFLVAFRRRGSYDTSQPDSRPWLYGIATNLLHRKRRAEVRQYRALARTGVDPVSGGDEDAVLARVAAVTVTRRLGAALAALSQGERDVLLLVAWEELSYDEVAQAMSIPVGTVRSRLHRGRKRLRAALPDLDPATLDSGMELP
ncbi:MAG: hypothetical protein JWO79_285 [Actinomycetia bacterium]|jgi:RNA polymerase sigma-70 factor (ECF subfamily)|nr:hypothetical protein [Actinomycetes bacterium]MDQ1653707.1 hypothetical protein [Cryptosporangiaceae bacterium]MDQ1659778.1 hypothetical protein [Cryptosporangiaceae bacterium]